MIRSVCASALALALAAAGCLGGDNPGGGGGEPIDASAVTEPDSGRQRPPPPDAAAPPDAAIPDAAVDYTPEYLLLTEVMTGSFGDVTGTDAEFVEIWNPTDKTFDLSVYFLADTHAYATVPAGQTSPGASSDFIVRFPVGASIGGGDVIVVAIDGAGFAEAYGEAPDFAIRDAGDVPEMTVVSDGGTGNIGFTNAGEAVVLFHWDGLSNLVQDVDMVVAGVVDDPDSANNILDKTGLEVDGPADGKGTYRVDAATMALAENQFDLQTAAGRSYKRIALPGRHITRAGGNGITGHDATSEAIRDTWENFADGRDYSEPTPGQIPGALRDEAASP
jgi:hypothetical protein